MRIYHLLSSEHAISNIELNRMKIARYDDLNDPFELMASDLSNKEMRRAVGVLKNHFHKNRGLLCFSKSWHNPVIWSHYADKHHGIALGFDVHDEFVAPIKYRTSRLPVKFKKNHNEGKLDSVFVNNLLYTKYKHWKYEEEVRLHVNLNECEPEGGLYFTSFKDVGIELKEVILGHSCETTLQSIRKLVKDKYSNINTFKARLAFRSFRVVSDQRTAND